MKVFRKSAMLALVILVLAIAFIALGAIQGDPMDTWRKAARICFECIGIG